MGKGHVNLDRANHIGRVPLPLPASHSEECVVEMQPRCRNPNSDITDLNVLPAFPSAAPAEWEGLFGPKEPLPKSTVRGLAPAEPLMLPQQSSMYDSPTNSGALQWGLIPILTPHQPSHS